MEKPHVCKIISKTLLCPKTYEFIIEFPERPKPGQFIHVDCGDGVLLRRPMSICDYYDNKLKFAFAVRGEGTKRLAKFSVGDKLDVLGPLGIGFSLDKKGSGTPLVVGGGIGIFPLYFALKHLGEKAEAIIGFKTKAQKTMESEFNLACANTQICTDDGSYGSCGLVTDLLTERLKKGDITSIYVCGPTEMMKAVSKIANENNIFCELSLEERMGCGIGACAVCVCKISGQYKKVCQNGPVFNAKEVDFD